MIKLIQPVVIDHQHDLMEVCESENFDDGLQNLQDKLRKQQE